jgi:hypothetical protein
MASQSVKNKNAWSTNPLNQDHTSEAASEASSVHSTEKVPTIRHHKSITITLFPHQTHFVSGQPLTGHLNATFKSAVKIRSLIVDVVGTEQIDDPQTPPRFLHHQSYVIQSVHGPPSDAVVSDSVPDAKGYRAALKGDHSFTFEFALPRDLPSSIVTAHGTIRYLISVYVLCMVR